MAAPVSRCRCFRCKAKPRRSPCMSSDLSCPAVLEIRALRGVDNYHDIEVRDVLRSVHGRRILREARVCSVGDLQHSLSSRGVILDGNLVVSLGACARWRWLFLSLLPESLYCARARSHGDNVVCTRQQFDWQLFIHEGRLWLWRSSTEECFYVENPPRGWTRYQSPADNQYWWQNDLSRAWFFER